MQHKDVKKGNVHVIHNYEFEDITKMNEFAGSEEDLNKVCLVLEPYGFYALKNINPIEWKALSTVTIDLEDFSVLSAEETIARINEKANTYNIQSSEFSLGYKRGGLEVFGIEIDCGALPNATSKNIAIPNYNANYTYWIDQQNSYFGHETLKSPISRGQSSATTNNSIFTVLSGGNIQITTLINLTSYTKNIIVLNYTKGA